MNRFDVPGFLRCLRARGSTLGEPLHYFARTGSTNSDAKQAARRGAMHGSLFLAEAQTAGRGRRGRHWFAAAGENLTFSVVLRPELSSEELSPLTLAAGLATLDAVKEAGQAAGVTDLNGYKLKWPNDLVVATGDSNKITYRKLAGLLLETEVQDQSTPPAVIAGLGLNVSARNFPEDLRNIATSLAIEGLDCSREELLVSILSHMSMWVERYERRGRGVLAEGLAKADALLKRPVTVEIAGQAPVKGTGAGIREDGALLVDIGPKVVPVMSGTIAAGWFGTPHTG